MVTITIKNEEYYFPENLYYSSIWPYCWFELSETGGYITIGVTDFVVKNIRFGIVFVDIEKSIGDEIIGIEDYYGMIESTSQNSPLLIKTAYFHRKFQHQVDNKKAVIFQISPGQ